MSNFKFKKRLRYYMIGFGGGIMMMFLIFGNRACSWLPENRVKNMIAEKQIIVGDSVWDLMLCQGVDENDIYRFLNADGDVDFSDSETHDYPKKYLFKGDKNNEDLTITFALYEEYSEVIDFDFPAKNCTTTISNEIKKIVPIPDAEVRKIIESLEMRFMELATCQMLCYGLTKDQVKEFHKEAEVYMPETDPYEGENGFYTMNGKISGKSYKIRYTRGENRIRVADIEGETICNCR